tara:strand:+ start:263 stop:535 length:273 start_codon:yes stop_codon:yes gene_type:complete
MDKLDKDKYIKYLEKEMMLDRFYEHDSVGLINDITRSVDRILYNCGDDDKALEIYSKLSRERYINREIMSDDEYSEWIEKCEIDKRKEEK